MNPLRRRWTWLSNRLIGRRALVALVLIILTIAFLLFNREHKAGSSGLGSIELRDSIQTVKSNAVRRPQSPQLSSLPPPSPISEVKLKIPKRIHHFFEDAVDIPTQLAQAVNSWANNHKNYNAYFWDSRYLEKRLLPNLPLYLENKRCFQAERHTVSRLLLLLSQGGVLADPDLMSLRNFDSFLDGSTCVMAQEPPEVAVLFYGIEDRSLPSLRFAACRPDHPFVRLLLRNFCRRALEVSAGEREARSQRVTASALAAAFEAAVSAYDDACARRVCDHSDRIVLADAGVFLPLSPTGGLRSRLSAACSDVAAAGGGSKAEQLACRRLRNPLEEDGTRLNMASLAMPMTQSEKEAETAPRIRLNRIGPNVGRAAVGNWLLPDAAGTKLPP